MRALALPAPRGAPRSTALAKAVPGWLVAAVILFAPLAVNPVYSMLKTLSGVDVNWMFAARDLWVYALVAVLTVRYADRQDVVLAALGIVVLVAYGFAQQALSPDGFDPEQYYFLARSASVFFFVACAPRFVGAVGISPGAARAALVVFLVATMLELVVEAFSPGFVHNFVYGLPLYFASKGVVANTSDGLLTHNRIVSTLYSPSQLGLLMGGAFGAIVLSWPRQRLFRRSTYIMLATMFLIAVASVGKLGIAMMFLAAFFRRRSAAACEWLVVLALGSLVLVATTASGYSIHVASALAHVDGLRTGLVSMVEHPLGLGVGAAGIVSTLSQAGASMPPGGESLVGATLAGQGFAAALAFALFVAAARTGVARRVPAERSEAVAYYKLFLVFVIAAALNENTSNPVVWTIPVFLMNHGDVANESA